MALTIEDIRNPARKSGFNYVGFNRSKPPRGHGGGAPYFAKHNYGGGSNPDKPVFIGPRRLSGEEAAQDLCDYMNGQATPAAPALKRVTRSKPATGKRLISRREAEARRVIREELAKNPPVAAHKPVCYLVGVKGDAHAVKVGHADYDVHSRLGSLQTGNPRELVLLGTLPGGKRTEGRLHRKYVRCNQLGEWFSPVGPLLSEFGLNTPKYIERITV